MDQRTSIDVRPGLSAFEMLKVERVLLVVGSALAASGVLLAGLAGTGLQILTPIAVGSLLIGGIGIILYNTSVLSLARQAAEAAMGYTTIPSPNEPDLRLVLPRTGLVVRDIGDEAMGWDAYRRLVRNASATL